MHSSVNGQLGCFHVLAIANNAAMSNGVHVSLFNFGFLRVCFIFWTIVLKFTIQIFNFSQITISWIIQDSYKINFHILYSVLCLVQTFKSKFVSWLRVIWHSILCWLPRQLSGKESICQCRRFRRCGPWVRKIPWGRKWIPTPVFLPGKSHGERSLAGYSPHAHKVRHNLETKPATGKLP